MANIKANVSAGNLSSQQRVPSNLFIGRMRWLEATVTIPATGGPAVGETIEWCTVVPGTRFLTGFMHLSFSAGAASSTINLGDAVNPTRYLAATAVAASGNALGSWPTAGVTDYATTENAPGAKNDCTLVSTVAGAALAPGQVITLRIPFVND